MKGLRSYFVFGHFWKKPSIFHEHFTPWIWRHLWNLMIHFSDTVNSRFRRCNWFWTFSCEHWEAYPSFQVDKLAIFWKFFAGFQFLKTPWQRRSRGISYSRNSDKINLQGISLHPTEHWLLDPYWGSYQINTSYFLNNCQINLIFQFLITLSGAIFDFHQNYNIVLNYNHLGICGENFFQFGGYLMLWQKNPGCFVIVIHQKIFRDECSVYHQYLNTK